MDSMKDSTVTFSARKGIAYDWQALYASSLTEQLDEQLMQLTPEYAE
jgi:hypothetical protein